MSWIISVGILLEYVMGIFAFLFFLTVFYAGIDKLFGEGVAQKCIIGLGLFVVLSCLIGLVVDIHSEVVGGQVETCQTKK